MSGVIRLQSTLLGKRLLPSLRRRQNISTSKKNSDTIDITTSAEGAGQKSAAASGSDVVAKSNKNWVSYGFEKSSEAADRRSMHSIFFAAVSVCLCFGTFLLVYVPDYSMRDWAQREAFLELRRRERAGLPLIDANLIDPAKIYLPSDEELGDTEIII